MSQTEVGTLSYWLRERGIVGIVWSLPNRLCEDHSLSCPVYYAECGTRPPKYGLEFPLVDRCPGFDVIPVCLTWGCVRGSAVVRL